MCCHPLCAVLAVLLVSSIGEAAAPLATAKALANGKYKGWTYGVKASEKKIDCVQFVLAVVEEAAAQSLNLETRQRILIANLTKEERENLERLITSEDAKIRGVQQALVAIKRGTVVKPSEAKKGDLIQYWMRKEDDTWFGHAGIIEEVERSGSTYQANIFGAHKSANGIATSKFKLKLSGQNRKVFIVRMK